MFGVTGIAGVGSPSQARAGLFLAGHGGDKGLSKLARVLNGLGFRGLGFRGLGFSGVVGLCRPSRVVV